MRRKKTMSENSKPVYDNPNLLLHWEREFIKTSIRWYVDKWRDFLEKNPDIKDTNIERWEARQEHIMEKLKQFQDQNEPEDDDEDDEEIIRKAGNNE
jgi:hypothetical protein